MPVLAGDVVGHVGLHGVDTGTAFETQHRARVASGVWVGQVRRNAGGKAVLLEDPLILTLANPE